MAYIKGINIVIGADTTKLDLALRRIDTNTRGLNKELREVNGSLKFDPKNTDLLAQKVKILNERYKETKDRLDALKNAQEEVNQAYERGEISEDQYRQFQSDLAITESRLKGFGDQLKDVTEQYNHHTSAIGKTSEKMKDFGDKATEVAGKLKPLSVATAGVLTLATKQAIEFESAFAGVAKTFPGTQEELAKTRDEIRQLAKDIPATTTELSEIAESAGQLGIKSGNIMEFTRTIADMGVATNLAGEEAATTLARFANITQMSQENFSNLGSSIVALGNNFATTEAEIAHMALNLASAGRQIKLSEADILALATGLSSVGMQAQAGGTAFSKVMVEMQLATETGTSGMRELNDTLELYGWTMKEATDAVNVGGKELKNLAGTLGMTSSDFKKLWKETHDAKDSLDDFAIVAGMTADQFTQAFKEDAMGAILAFIDGLAGLDEQGESAIKVLDEMGIKEIRLRDALLRATNANEIFNDAISVSNDAWEENTALTEEATIRYETTESKIKIMRNRLNDVAITIGEKLLPHVVKFAEWLGNLVDGFNQLNPSTQDFIVKALAISAVSAPLIGTVGKLSSGFGGLLGTVGTVGRKFGLFKSATTPVVEGLSTVAGGLTATGTASGGFLASMGSAIAPLAPWALGLGAVAVAGYGVYKTLDKEVIPTVDLFADKLEITSEKITTADGQVIDQYTANTVTISEETKERLSSFMELSEEAQRMSMEMYTGIEDITDNSVKNLFEKNKEMSDSIIENIERQRDESKKRYEQMFDNSTSITESERNEIIRLVEEGADKRVKAVDNTRGELESLYLQIESMGVGITKSQQERIDGYYDQMKEHAVKAMSDSQIEQEVIFNRLENSNTRVTAEMVGEVIRDFNRMHDETIDEAEKMRNEIVEDAIRMKSELGPEAEAIADKLIEEANRQYAETVEATKKTRNEGLDKLRAGYDDLVDNIDTNTGDILTQWDKIKRWWDNTTFADKRSVITTVQRTEHETIYKKPVGSTYAPSHLKYNDGLPYVPYNMRVNVHEGEMILKKTDAEQLRQKGYIDSMKNKLGDIGNTILNQVDNSVENVNVVMGGTYHIREEADIHKLSVELANQVSRMKRG